MAQHERRTNQSICTQQSSTSLAIPPPRTNSPTSRLMDQPTKPKFKIISVESLGSYLDNTVAVVCWGYNGLDDLGHRFEVTQVAQPNQQGLHEVWVGHPGREDSYKLSSPEEIQHVAEMVHQHIQHQIQRAEVLIERSSKLAIALTITTKLPPVATS